MRVAAMQTAEDPDCSGNRRPTAEQTAGHQTGMVSARFGPVETWLTGIHTYSEMKSR
jgi:hypothetical protein